MSDETQTEGRDFDHYQSVEAKKDARDETETAMLDAQKAAQEATEAHDKAHTDYLKSRTESYDGDLVSKARDLGINPDNFDTEDALSGAVDTVQTLEQNKSDDAKIARGESLSDVE